MKSMDKKKDCSKWKCCGGPIVRLASNCLIWTVAIGLLVIGFFALGFLPCQFLNDLRLGWYLLIVAVLVFIWRVKIRQVHYVVQILIFLMAISIGGISLFLCVSAYPFSGNPDLSRCEPQLLDSCVDLGRHMQSKEKGHGLLTRAIISLRCGDINYFFLKEELPGVCSGG